MENKFTLIINSGRSGSTFLYNILKKNYPDDCCVIHEGLHCSYTKPKVFNRAYTDYQIEEILKVPEISTYIRFVENNLNNFPVIECGWTMAHLAPVFQHFFKERFQYIIMYRNPINFALSRSTMGNYFRYSFYKDKNHEVSPFDNNTMFPELKERWKEMNEFDKCLFWWLESVSEAFEFHNKYKDTVPNLVVKSETLFSSTELTSNIIKFMGLSEKFLYTLQDKNELHLFSLETFPIKDRWKTWRNNKEVLQLAADLGYRIDEEYIEKQIPKYQVPKKLLSELRHYLNYWIIKDYITTLTKTKRHSDIEMHKGKLKH